MPTNKQQQREESCGLEVTHAIIMGLLVIYTVVVAIILNSPVLIVLLLTLALGTIFSLLGVFDCGSKNETAKYCAVWAEVAFVLAIFYLTMIWMFRGF